LMSMLSRFEGALLGAAVGDALGMPVEGLSADEIRRRYGEVRDFVDGRLPRGSYTDDTEMMIAVAEAILERGIDVDYIAERMARSHNMDRGYGPGTILVFRAILRGKRWSEVSPRLFGEGSYGNGCLVRTAPLVLLLHGYREAMLKTVREVCRTTHAHRLSLEAVSILAEVMSLALEGKRDAREYLEVAASACESEVFRSKLAAVREALDRGEAAEKAAAKLGSGVEVHNTLPICLYLFLSNIDSFERAVLRAVNLGGDADTNGAVVGCLSGALHGSEAIPERWRYGVEAYDRIIDIANRLYELRMSVDEIYRRVVRRLEEERRPAGVA